MKLTTAEGYALRAMVFLARQDNGGKAFSLADIAQKEQLPFPFLEQIFRDLRHMGLISSIRGAQGGYRLGKSPKQISVLAILEAISGKIELLECNREFCPQGSCSVAPFLVQLQRTIEKTLNQTKLADLVQADL